MLFSYVSGQQQIGNNKKCTRIAGDFDCHADAAVRRTTRGALPNRAHPELHLKPLDAVIRRVPALYCPSGYHGRQIRIKHTKH